MWYCFLCTIVTVTEIFRRTKDSGPFHKTKSCIATAAFLGRKLCQNSNKNLFKCQCFEDTIICTRVVWFYRDRINSLDTNTMLYARQYTGFSSYVDSILYEIRVHTNVFTKVQAAHSRFELQDSKYKIQNSRFNI